MQSEKETHEVKIDDDPRMSIPKAQLPRQRFM
jgi:hypothetical protein